jgi:hypothetical protein
MVLDVEERFMTQRQGSKATQPDVADTGRHEQARVLIHQIVNWLI